MTKTTSGFTLVETITTIVIIAILAGIGGASYYRIQSNSRDSQRLSSTNALAIALENYYNENGEYPSCNDMTQDIGTITSKTLEGIDQNILITPKSLAKTNSIICDSPTMLSDTFGYIDGVDQFTLEYYSESSNKIVKIQSQHRPLMIDSPTTPVTTVVLSEPNVLASVAPPTCVRGTIQYAIRSRNDNGTWSNYSAWSSTTTAAQPATIGVKYDYQAKAKCYDSRTAYSLEVEGSEASYINPIPTPSAPILAINTIANVTTWSWPAVTCTTGDVSYRYSYTISPSGYNSGWTDNGANMSIAFTTSLSGQTYTVTAQARCIKNYAVSNWSLSGSANYILPAVPSTPITTVFLNGANIQATITPVTCLLGTIQYGIAARINDGAWGSFSPWSTSLTTAQIANSGVKYGYKSQARCFVDATTYSSTASGIESTYINPIPTPSAPVVVANTVATTTTWSWPAVNCAGGTTNYQYRYTISPSGYDSGWASNGTNLSFTAATATGGQTYTLAAQARCIGTYSTSGWSTSNSAVYILPANPSAPSMSVSLNSANVQANINLVTCSIGTIQYSTRSRTNDGSWGSYTVWAATTTFTQIATDGTKYGYQAQARCYLNASAISSTATGAESTYIDPIVAPSAPTVTANNSGDNTTWSWPGVSCTAGTANYAYDYVISPSGYDSGWISNGGGLSFSATTTSGGQTYTIYARAQCSNAYSTSGWSGNGSANYYVRSGILTLIGNASTISEATGVSVSSDGLLVNVAGAYWTGSYTMVKHYGTFSYDRDLNTGLLGSMYQTYSTTPTPINTVTAPDGKSVYTLGTYTTGCWSCTQVTHYAVYMYSRNPSSGITTPLTPSYVDTITFSAGIAISPDGKSVYVIGYYLGGSNSNVRYDTIYSYSRD